LGKNITPTKLAHQSNVPYDRFQEYLRKLIEMGLVTHEEETLALTQEGIKYLEEFSKIIQFLKRMGLQL
jgi:predicted transcriptional regulator